MGLVIKDWACQHDDLLSVDTPAAPEVLREFFVAITIVIDRHALPAGLSVRPVRHQP